MKEAQRSKTAGLMSWWEGVAQQGWKEAVFAEYGNIKMTWEGQHTCHLANGEVYRPADL